MVSVAISPAMLPDTSVTTANPERVEVSWAKAPGTLPEHKNMRSTRMSKRTGHLLVDFHTGEVQSRRPHGRTMDSYETITQKNPDRPGLHPILPPGNVASVPQSLCVMIAARHLRCASPIVTSTHSCLPPEIY